MQSLWRALPRLVLPAALGLGLAYLGTGFLPGPEPALRPPEELRALGQGFGEESPVRAIFERNVLQLESHPFAPPGTLAPPVEPLAAAAALARPNLPQAGPDAGQQNQTEAAFAPLEPVLLPLAGRNRQRSPLSGGSSVQGLVASPANGGGGPEGFRLVGVVAGGAKPAAMLQVDGVALTMHPGGQAKGWTLVSIQPGQVTLRKGQDTRTLPLAGTQTGTQTGAAPATPTAPPDATPPASAPGQKTAPPHRP